MPPGPVNHKMRKCHFKNALTAVKNELMFLIMTNLLSYSLVIAITVVPGSYCLY